MVWSLILLWSPLCTGTGGVYWIFSRWWIYHLHFCGAIHSQAERGHVSVQVGLQGWGVIWLKVLKQFKLILHGISICCSQFLNTINRFCVKTWILMDYQLFGFPICHTTSIWVTFTCVIFILIITWICPIYFNGHWIHCVVWYFACWHSWQGTLIEHPLCNICAITAHIENENDSKISR